MNTNQAGSIAIASARDLESGYRHSLYAASFEEFGVPLHLPGSDGWLLERSIPGSNRTDAMGCYPLFSCRDWHALRADLRELEGKLVSVSLVSDPFAPVDQGSLASAFKFVIPFKRHFVTDLSIAREQAVSKHHRQCARKAIKQVEVSVWENPAEFVDTWSHLYGVLSRKHSIKGMRRFSRNSFEKQLRVPGTVILAATHQDEVVGATWWFLQDDVAYEHLAAFSETGYRLMASYALVWAALEHFRGRAAWLHLGAAAGLNGDTRDGLTFFKCGWATGTRTAYLCGRILDPREYAVLVDRGRAGTSYFPAYRAGEFG